MLHRKLHEIRDNFRRHFANEEAALHPIPERSELRILETLFIFREIIKTIPGRIATGIKPNGRHLRLRPGGDQTRPAGPHTGRLSS